MLARVYEQQFTIASEYYQIQKFKTHPEKKDMFRLFHKNYTVLCESEDIAECRKAAHAHAVDHFNKLIEGHKIAIDFYEGLVTQLGNEPDNLDSFKLVPTSRLTLLPTKP